MRIAYLCQSFPPMISGASLAVQQLSRGIVARGHSALVLAASETGKAYSIETENSRIVKLRSYKNPARVGQHYLLYPAGQILKELQLFKPDLVHLHDPLGTGIAGLKACRLMKIPAILTIHQLPWFATTYIPKLPVLQSGMETVLWSYARWLVRQCQAVIAPSCTVAKYVYAQTSLHAAIISVGIDLERFSPHPGYAGESAFLQKKYSLQPHLPVVLYTGRLDADKQVDLVLRTAALAMKKTRFQLLIVGDGKLKTNLIQLSQELGIRHQCHFTGYIDPFGDLAGIYRMASIFVTASEVETLSLVGLEAAASSLPIVAFRAAAIPEIVDDGNSGFLVQAGDLNAMADKIIDLLYNPEMGHQMGRAGRMIASSHSLENSIFTHLAFYESIYAQPGRDQYVVPIYQFRILETTSGQDGRYNSRINNAGESLIFD